MSTLILKIMSSEDIEDGDSRKQHNIIANLSEVNFGRLDNGECWAFVKTADDPAQEARRLFLPGNAYVIDSSSGRTVDTFGIASHANSGTDAYLDCDRDGVGIADDEDEEWTPPVLHGGCSQTFQNERGKEVTVSAGLLDEDPDAPVVLLIEGPDSRVHHEVTAKEAREVVQALQHVLRHDPQCQEEEHNIRLSYNKLCEVRDALDMLGLALVEEHHCWTPGERAAYETAIRVLQKAIPSNVWRPTVEPGDPRLSDHSSPFHSGG